jgi:hypothetical protein
MSRRTATAAADGRHGWTLLTEVAVGYASRGHTNTQSKAALRMPTDARGRPVATATST